MTADLTERALAETIRRGSQSFSLAAQLFDPQTRRGALALYAWCRHCDDMIDGQLLGHGRLRLPGDPAERLRALRAETLRACAGDEVADPAFAALGRTVRRHRIPRSHPLQLLEGLRMDVAGRRYRRLSDTLDYAYHVAGVVGVMMSMVMGARDPDVLDRASDLGIALQLTNIARDVMDDARMGRVYLPEEWLRGEGVEPATIAHPACREGVARVVLQLLGEADRYFDSSTAGIGALPLRSALAVAAARCVYADIGRIVRRRGAAAWDGRAAAGPARKAVLLAAGGWLAGRARVQPVSPRDPALLVRPG